MKERFAIAPTYQGESEAYKLAAVEGAQDLAADFRGDHEYGYWNHIHIGRLPDFTFYLDAKFKFVQAMAMADDDFIGRGDLILLGVYENLLWHGSYALLSDKA